MKLTPKNRTAKQLLHRAEGNPPSTLPNSAISNCYPGLEFDFRNVWRRIFKGIVMHEADSYVVDVASDDPDLKALLHSRILKVDGLDMTTILRGPRQANGPAVDLTTPINPDGAWFMEWSNSLSRVLDKGGDEGRVRLHRAAFADPAPPRLVGHADRGAGDPALLRGRISRHLARPHRARRSDAESLLAVAERLSRVRLLLLGLHASRLHRHRYRQRRSERGLQLDGSQPESRDTGRRARRPPRPAPGNADGSDVDHVRPAVPGVADSAEVHRRRERAGLSAVFDPRSPSAHLVGNTLFLPNGSRVFELDGDTLAGLDALLESRDEDAIGQRLRELGVDVPPLIDDTPLTSPPLRALSLAVAQKCNLGCTYCYAQQSDFGGAAKNMPLDTALESVELLFRDAAPGERFNLSFLGGEPLLNRGVIRMATQRALELARERGAQVTFSITTNGTLLSVEDAAFFELHGFAVTISIDGIGAVHDAQRAFKGGRESYAKIIANAEPLLRLQRRMQISARVTVTPHNLALRETLDGLLALGFHSVGFSPMLAP